MILSGQHDHCRTVTESLMLELICKSICSTSSLISTNNNEMIELTTFDVAVGDCLHLLLQIKNKVAQHFPVSRDRAARGKQTGPTIYAKYLIRNFDSHKQLTRQCISIAHHIEHFPVTDDISHPSDMNRNAPPPIISQHCIMMHNIIANAPKNPFIRPEPLYASLLRPINKGENASPNKVVSFPNHFFL